MFGLGIWEIVLVAVVALLVLGPRKLPEAARQVGRVMRELRRATNELKRGLAEDPLDSMGIVRNDRPKPPPPPKDLPAGGTAADPAHHDSAPSTAADDVAVAEGRRAGNPQIELPSPPQENPTSTKQSSTSEPRSESRSHE